jgi:hypothetical protein
MSFWRKRKVCYISYSLVSISDIASAPHYPTTADLFEPVLGHSEFHTLIRRFLFDQINPDSEVPGDAVDPDMLPYFNERIHVYHSAVATYYAPSDISGTTGLIRQRIRATPSWRKGAEEESVPRYDCVFLNGDPDLPGFQALGVARIRLFFSFIYQGVEYPCALVDWFLKTDSEPDSDTRMYVVEPEMNGDQRVQSVVHLDSILRGAHLVAVFGDQFVPIDLRHFHTLDAFRRFYVNKYVDAHAFEIVV